MRRFQIGILKGLTPNARWPAWQWAAVAVVALIDLLWLIATPLSLSSGSIWTLLNLLPLVVLGTWASSRLGAFPRLQVLCSGLCFLLVAWPALRLYNHLTMTTALPMADGPLAQMDSIIGFNWLSYVSWLDRHPLLLQAMDQCYTGLTGYSIAIFVLLAVTDHFKEACGELLELFVLMAIACATIGALFPAAGAIIYFNPAPDAFINIAPKTGAYHLDHLSALRTDANHVIDLRNLPGLVTMPSFHTAMGIAAIYCTRRTWWLFLPSLVVNSVMIASTPVFGAHYGIDIIGGSLVSWTAILAIRARHRGKAMPRPLSQIFSDAPAVALKHPIKRH